MRLSTVGDLDKQPDNLTKLSLAFFQCQGKDKYVEQVAASMYGIIFGKPHTYVCVVAVIFDFRSHFICIHPTISENMCDVRV